MKRALQNFKAAMQAAWQLRSLRERRWLQVGALVMGLAAMWSLALAPALRTWQEAPAKQIELDRQTQSMLQLQAQARQWQAAPAISRIQAITWLQAHAKDLAPDAKLQVQGDLVHLSFQAAPADALAEWIAQAREHAHARPVQAQMQQMPSPAKASSPNTPPVMWGGTLQLSLPG
jgi:general secretion pathway protein M